MASPQTKRRGNNPRLTASFILSTLAHEMAHLWQHHFGKPGRGRYHNMEWAERMKSIGLQPTSTGKEGGAETGDAMDHMIVPDGLFDRTVRKLLARGLVISWIEQPARTAASGDDAGDDEESKNKSGKRVRYVCPHGDMKAWAKHGAKLVCGEHMEPMDVHQPTPRDYRGITPTSEDPASEEDA